MSTRLEILKNSLAKKEALFSDKLQAHMDDVRSANGQPLNDKRNGQSTLNRWERQNDGLRTLQDSIQKTKDAIEREEGKIAGCEYVKNNLPTQILEMVELGELIQWRKYPHIFFVKGVDKARIIWDKGKVMHKYSQSITDKEQWKKFAQTFNSLSNSLNK